MKTRSKPLERIYRMSKETREIEDKEQAARTRPENFERDCRILQSRSIQNKGQTARKRLANLETLKTRSKPLERF